jgi:hypothetical protein
VQVAQADALAQAYAAEDAIRRVAHQNLFPLQDNLTSLLFICLADMNEQQEEIFTSTMTLR